jgi:hypothetical protein
MGALDEYLTTLAESLESLRSPEFDPRTFDEAIVQNVTSFLPYRDEYWPASGHEVKAKQGP